MEIQTEAAYTAALHQFEALATADYAADPAKKQQLIELRDAIDAYENSHGHAPDPPHTLAGRIELEMFKRRLKQNQLAELLRISPSRLSEVLRGRRKVNLYLAKRLYKELQIPAEFILEVA